MDGQYTKCLQSDNLGKRVKVFNYAYYNQLAEGGGFVCMLGGIGNSTCPKILMELPGHRVGWEEEGTTKCHPISCLSHFHIFHPLARFQPLPRRNLSASAQHDRDQIPDLVHLFCLHRPEQPGHQRRGGRDSCGAV